MNKIDIGAPLAGERRDRFFARAVGTQFAAKTDAGATTIDLYDEIGYWGVTAKAFRARLKEAKGDINLRINSPGGDVFDGIAIYNDLLAYDGGKVKVEITGVAASIASIIAMAGDERVIAPNAFFMVHNAWTIGVGNRHDFTDVAATLTKIDDALARTYAAQTSSGIRQIKTWMDDETWMSASEAVDAGFATSVLDAETEVKAKFDLSVFSSVPKSLVWDEDDVSVETEQDVEKLLMRDAGKTRSQARALIRDIRAGTTSTPEVKPGAGGVDLTQIAAALERAKAAFHHTTT